MSDGRQQKSGATSKAARSTSETKPDAGTKRRSRQPSVIATTKMACSVLDVCTALGVSRPTVYLMIQRGELRSVKVGRRRLIPASELDRVLSGAA
jgi:excisionase family DNA binding protein